MTALAVDAGRTLLFDREKLIALADAKSMAIQAFSLRADPRRGTKGRETGNEAGMSAAVERVRVAVVGVGEFGRNHARVYRELEDVELVGVFDRDPAKAQAVAAEFDTE